MNPKRLPNGKLLVPVAFYDEKTGISGDGMAEIGPDHPDYESWTAEIERMERLGIKIERVPPKRFRASVTLGPDHVRRDIGMIANEILSHLSALPGAKLKVSVEVEAELPEGVPEYVQRTVSENAWVLKFDSYGFE